LALYISQGAFVDGLLHAGAGKSRLKLIIIIIIIIIIININILSRTQKFTKELANLVCRTWRITKIRKKGN